jgi:hypothetical protein
VVRTNFLIDQPAWFSIQRLTAKAAKRMRSVLDMQNDFSISNSRWYAPMTNSAVIGVARSAATQDAIRSGVAR